MSRIPGIRRVFRFPWSSRAATRARVSRDVDDELSFHLDMVTRELVERGVAPDEAQHLARARFGDLPYTRHYMRSLDDSIARRARRAELLDELRQDVRYAVRQLRRNQGFAAVALLTLALAIGANTAIFSVVRGVLLRDLPYADPDRLVRVITTLSGTRTSVSPLDFTDWRAQSRAFSALAASYESTVNLTGAGEPERFAQARVSANLFDVLGVRPTVGRAFARGEDEAGAPRVVVLSDGLWRRRFGADPGIVGRKIVLDDHPTEVIGVAPAEMRYPEPVDLWLTTRFSQDDLAASSRGARWIQVIGRLVPGATLEQARSEMTAIARRLEQADPEHNAGVGVELVTLREQIVGGFRAPLLILLGAVALVLLIACANVASLLLGRTAARGGELAVRTALGAGRGRLVRQLLTESMILALGGGALGLFLAAWGTRTLVAVAPADIPRLYDVRLDGVVLAFTVVATLLTVVLFGLIPALHASAAQVSLQLRDGSRGSQARPGRARGRAVLVVGEMALAIVLLAGAGLLLRSFARLRDVDPGFRAVRVSTFTATLSPVKYPRVAQQGAFARTLVDRLQALPGVESAAVTFGLPLTSASFQLSFDVSGRPAPSPNAEPRAQVRMVTPGYFATMGIPLVRGRTFAPEDREDSRPVVIISQETARRYFPGEDPIGKRVETGWRRDDGAKLGGEIVGVVGDVKHRTLHGDVAAHLYAPFDQWPVDELTVVMRARGEPDAVLGAVRGVVASLDRDVPLYDVMTLDDLVSAALGQPRFYLLLLAAFAGVAVTLAAVGIYGVIAYLVQQRTREIGIRIALGATAERVVGMVVRQGLALAVLGIVLGVAGGVAVTRVLASLLYGVGARDPWTFAGVAVLLGGIALLASWLPARRAARVDPLTAMRGE